MLAGAAQARGAHCARTSQPREHRASRVGQCTCSLGHLPDYLLSAAPIHLRCKCLFARACNSVVPAVGPPVRRASFL